MKRNNLKLLILPALFLSLMSFESRGQSSGFDGFSVKVSPGALSYFGDLSNHNLNLPKRIVEGSKFGIGVEIIKQFAPYFGIQAQFIAGSLYSEATDNTYFAGSLNEFSLSARFDPLLLIKKNTFKLSPYVSVGVGTFGFRSVRREMGTNLVLLPDFGYENDGVTRAPRQTAMSLPIAIGLSWTVLPNIQLELEHALRFTNTDLIDSFKGPSTANDLYSLTSIGLRFTIPTQSSRKAYADRNAIDKNEDKPQKEVAPLIPINPETNVFVACEIPERIQPGQTVDVKLRINKGKFKGTAKLIQKLPDGFTAIENLKNTNSFLFSNQNVFIEWKQMPADSIVSYNYQIHAGESMSGSQTITGRFEYQDAEGSKTVRFNKTVFIESSDLAGTKEINDNRVVKQDDSAISGGGKVKGNIRQSQALSGIEFRVQCGALRDRSQAYSHLSEKYRITETIQEEYIDGWYKYTVGSFRTYEEAARYRDSFIDRTKILSSFIVAYRDGHRLSNINEAFK